MSAERLFLTPSLKVTGGNLEIIRLAREVADRNIAVRLVAMWRAGHEADTHDLSVTYLSEDTISPRKVLSQAAVVTQRFRDLLRHSVPGPVVFSHYVTFILFWCVNRSRRWFFVQDTEWLFVNGIVPRTLLKRFINFCFRRGKIISANRYLTNTMLQYSIPVDVEAPIWADRAYLGNQDSERTTDIAVMMRRGAHKRADLTLALIDELYRRLPHLTIIAISPDDTYRSSMPPHVTYVVGPSITDMRAIYQGAKIFALMSEHEGFGLPPLEAMGSGCVPVCRDAGGVRSYMVDELLENVIPRDRPTSIVAEIIIELLGDKGRWERLSKLATKVFDEGQRQSIGRVDNLLAAGF